MNGTKNKETKNDERGLLPYSIIVAANTGESEAMRLVLQHYDRYITILSMKKLQDEYGNVYRVIDTEMKGLLKSKLLWSIFDFKI